MKRRSFLALAGAAAALPRVAFAQQAKALPRAPGGRPWLIGALVNFTKTQSDLEFLGPFTSAMADLGYVEGRDFRIEARYTDGDLTRGPALAAQVLALGPDLIVASAGGVAAPARQLTMSIPIISSTIQAPNELDLLIGKDLAHPKGNVTGVADDNFALVAKHCELALELVPRAKRIGILVGTASDGGKAQRDAVATAAAARKFTPLIVDVATANDIAPAFRVLADQGLDAVVIGSGGGGFAADRPRTVQLASALGVPDIYNQPGYVEAGGLISYGSNRRATSARLASFADLILRGARPGDLPVEQISTFSVALNLPRAKLLGLAIPATVLALTDQMIQ